MRSDQIALQLYTVRAVADRDILGTLERLAAVGCGAVELAGHGNASVAEIRATLGRLGMRAIGEHVGLEAFENDPDRAIADTLELGCEYLIVPWLKPEWRSSGEAVRDSCRRIAGVGERCRGAGLRFAYHNHDFEFTAVDGVRPWDLIVESTDPAIVELELDLFWVRHVGLDPAGLIRRYHDRVSILHMKDAVGDGSGSDCPVGEGVQDWSAILEAGRAAAVRWYVVEQEQPAEPIAEAKRSLDYLTGLAIP